MADQLAAAKEKTVKREAPWLIRTYSGYASAKESNALYRKNLARGQTGLSIAFDLPTQTGYDSDHVLARGEVGKVGVPVCHVGDMETLLDGIPLDKMNTSMTINAPAAWLLSLYIAAAERRGVARAAALGHDAERHHQGIPVARHLHLPAGAVDAADLRRRSPSPTRKCRSGTRSTSAPTTCRRRGRRRSRSWRSRWPPPSPCSTR